MDRIEALARTPSNERNPCAVAIREHPPADFDEKRLRIHDGVSISEGTNVGPTSRSRSREGADQYGQPFPVPDANWTASGGTVDETGRFIAGADKGFFMLTAVAGVLEATTDVPIAPKQGPGKPQDQQQGLLRWSGPVLQQK